MCICSRFREGFSLPLVQKIRENVKDKDIDYQLARDFLEKAEGDRSEKLVEALRWGISYRDAYMELSDKVGLAHTDASLLEEALFTVRDLLPVLVKDVRTALRVLGNACQQVKVSFSLFWLCSFSQMSLFQTVRELNYSKPLDSKFKQFIAQKKRGNSAQENQKSRSDAFVIDDLAKVAKEFG